METVQKELSLSHIPNDISPEKKLITKSISLTLFQFDFLRFDEKEDQGSKNPETFQKHFWDHSIFIPISKDILAKLNSGEIINWVDSNNNLTIILDQFSEDDEFFKGKFILFEYGRVAPLRNKLTLEKRDNPKNTFEGEEEYVHFLIRKSDGLIILQQNQKFTRSKLLNFFNTHFLKIITDKDIFGFDISILLNNDFLMEVQKLDFIKGTQLEILSNIPSVENEFVSSIQNEMNEIKSNHVQLFFKARYKNRKLRNIIPFVNKYKFSPGVSSIKVVGQKNGIEKILNLQNSSEKIKIQPTVATDGNILTESLFYETIEVIKKKEILLRK